MRRTTLLALALAACGPAPPPLPSPVNRCEPRAPTESARPPAAPTEERPASAGLEASPFRVLGELVRFSALSQLRNRAFIALEHALLTIDGEDVGFDPRLMAGLQTDSPLWTISALGGDWPAAAWLATTESGKTTGIVRFYRWRGERWVRVETLPEGKVMLGVLPWIGESTLALLQESLAFGASFKLMSGAPRAVVPEFTRGASHSPGCAVKLRAEVFAALPSGHLFVGGPSCAARPSAASKPGGDADWDVLGGAVERWAPGARRGTVEALPELGAGRSFTLKGMAAVSANEVYVAGEFEPTAGDAAPYFARFDGSGWTRLPSPVPGFVDQLWAESEGALWLSDTRGRLYRRPPSGTFAEVAHPAAIAGLGSASSVWTLALWPRAPGDVWAVVRAGEKTFLLHTRPATNPVRFPRILPQLAR